LLIFLRRLEGLKPPTGTDWKGHGRGWKIYIYTYIIICIIYKYIITKMEDDPHAALDTKFQCYREEREKPFCCGG